MAVLAVALAVVGVAGCSSSGGHATAATTTVRPPAADPTATVAAFCDASKRLTALEQTTSGTQISDVAANIVALRAIAKELATHAPPSIAGPTARYAVVIAAVADALAQRSPSSQTAPPHQLTQADTAALSGTGPYTARGPETRVRGPPSRRVVVDNDPPRPPQPATRAW